MKKQLLTFTFLFGTLLLTGQSYFTAGGIRLGTDWGLSVQQRVAKRLTVEGILQSSLSREEVLFTGLLEKHMPLITRHFNVYAGAGLHKGWYQTADSVADNPFGLSFVGGLELTLGRLNMSYDFKPAINLTGGSKTFYAQTALSFRYVLVKDNFIKQAQRRQKKRKKQKAKGKNEQDWKFWQEP